MTLEFLNPNTYTFAGGVPVRQGKDLVIPDSIVLSQTMLIKWQIRNLAKGATIEQIPPATLSAVLEIPGMGVLDRSDAQILASQQGKDVVQLWTIDPSLPYKVTFSEVSDLVTNSVLEFYSSSIEAPIETHNMGVNNPIVIDTTSLAQAMGAQVGTGVQQALANNNLALEAKSSKTEEVKIRPWSGDINNHRILDADLTRLSVHGFHPGKNLNPQNISDVFIATGTTDGRDQNRYDYVMNAGGEYNSDPNKETLPLFAWVAATAPTTKITVTRYFSTPPAAPVAPVAPPAPPAPPAPTA